MNLTHKKEDKYNYLFIIILLRRNFNNFSLFLAGLIHKKCIQINKEI